jgi:hypothetical protein
VSDELERKYEGSEALQQLLTKSGSLADVEDVAGAFAEAAKLGAPAAVVIPALWDDEPRFEDPAHARRLYANLLGLYELVASGERVDLKTGQQVKIKREKAPLPEHFGPTGPDEDFVEATWRYLDDFPREVERLNHAFDNRQDALVSFLDGSGLSDAGFALARHVTFELFAMLELGGRQVPTVIEKQLPAMPTEGALPEALAQWVEDSVFEAASDETEPLSEAETAQVKSLILRAGEAFWRTA